MSLRVLTLTALASVALPACHTVRAVPPADSPPAVADILRGASAGIALVTPPSDVSHLLPSYEYVIFPTAAYRWNSPHYAVVTDESLTNYAQACDRNSVVYATDHASDTGESTFPSATTAGAWTQYCRGASLTSAEWSVIDHSKLPNSLARCCASGCRSQR